VLSTLHIHCGRSVTQLDEWPGEDPVQQLERLIELGCGRLVLIDVDAAKGVGHNREVVASLMARFRQAVPKGCIQVGGGIRGSDHAQFFLDQGATWLLVGTLLHRSVIAVDQMMARFHEHLTAAIDARGGFVHRSGWADRMELPAAEVARQVRAAGFRRALFVDIPGPAGGAPDFETARIIAEHARLPLLMGGSLRTQADVEGAAAVPGLQGVQIDALHVLAVPALLEGSRGACCLG